MSKKEVWEIIKNENIPKNRRTVKCKWIFKIKRNGVFRARLVACEHGQIHGIDHVGCKANLETTGLYN